MRLQIQSNLVIVMVVEWVVGKKKIKLVVALNNEMMVEFEKKIAH